MPRARAAVYARPGPAAEVLEIRDIDLPAPGPGEVLVRVAVSGVNPTDFKQRSGASGDVARPLQVPNQDGAGVVQELGDGVDASLAGRRVWLYFAAWKRPWGTAAELCLMPASQVVPLPEGVDFDLGASMGIPALTAHRCLLADGPVRDKVVLVAGGAGAVGHFAIELARWLGAAQVIATVSSEEKAELARRAGADAVVDYRAEDAAAAIRRHAPGGVDRVVEVALQANMDLDRRVVADGAGIAAYAGGRVDADAELRARGVTVRSELIYTAPADAVRQAVADVTQALQDRALTPLPAHRFGLEDIAQAHDAVEAGAVGKVFVDVG